VNLRCYVVQELKSSAIDSESIVGGGERRMMIFFWLRGLKQQHYESLNMVSILETYCLSTHPCQ